jgi:transposase-like protein
MKKQNKFSPEVRERAVRMVQEHELLSNLVYADSEA